MIERWFYYSSPEVESVVRDICGRRAKLAQAVQEILQRIADLTKAQLETFQRRDETELMRLDKELENAMGLKERSIGALREHEKEHGC